MCAIGPVDPVLLDVLAARATAPSVVEEVGGWLLRAGPSLPFRRSNAVVALPGSPADPAPLAERVERVERFYRLHALPPRFQISPSTDPPDLEAFLAARGYRLDAPVDLLVAPVERVIAAADGLARPPAVRLRPTLERDWAVAYRACAAEPADEHTAGRLAGYRALLAAVEPANVAATVDLDGEPAAVGFGVCDRGFTGVFGMATRSDRRGRGAGRAVLAALAGWSREQRASTVYLQVERGNEPARSLYRSAGFVVNHAYHYRVLG